MKALIYSTFAPAAGQFAQLVIASGVRVMAVIAPRPDTAAGTRIADPKDFMDHLPRGTDVCFISGADRLHDIAGAYKPDIGVCAIYSWIIPPEVIKLHRFGIINVHASRLPDLRGPYPVAWAIRRGDKEIGMTAHYLEKDPDSGPVLAQCSAPMPADTSLPSMQPIFDSMNREVFPAALQRALKGDPGDVQGPSAGPWAGRFDEDYMEIDWGMPAAEISRQVRAWEWMPAGPSGKGPVTTIGGKRVRVLSFSLEQPQDGAGLRVDTGSGSAWITAHTPL